MKLFLKMGLLAVVLLTLESCSNTEVVKPTKSNLQNINHQLKSSVLDAQTSNNIPSKFYRVNPVYKDAYVHLRQGYNECSWASYVLTTGAIARAKGRDYEVTQNKISRVKDKCKEKCHSSPDPFCGAYITDLEWFAQTWDYTNVSKNRVSCSNNESGRFSMVKNMLNHIETKQTPFIAIGSTFQSNGKRIGHYYIIWSIDWKRGGRGSTIYYTDPLDDVKPHFNNQIKAESFSTFLDKMAGHYPSPKVYNVLFLW
ncbi:hypothetical protein [Microscilla marina]|uniref:Peptidase C39-like domain-containing protein n=1 Tax=Microscilla marina ATCC 23134 TaxID=313606 RepID=A1ZK08_MICM2|nr:hypothetical protein [Microscilla marina]EAY29461.1 hypothetical protein M23134_01521 [Microscilla marina ATCC 23134]